MISKKSIARMKDGSLLLSPEPSALPEALKKNDEIFNNFSFGISGLPAKDFRRETREEILSLAKEYTGRLFGHQPGTRLKPDGIGSRIVQTGHQPGFFHPGIMVKYPLLELLSKQLNGTGVNLAVDNDTAESTCFSAPSSDTPELTRKLNLFKENGACPLEYLKAPPVKELDTFLSSIETDLSTPLFKEILQNFTAWKERLRSYRYDNLRSATDFFVVARRVFLAGKNSFSLDIPVSTLGESSLMFFRFFWHLTKHAGEFGQTYNSELSEYRIRQRVRYPANPFPDLKIDDNTVELPFWFFHDKRRNPLFLKTVKGEKVLFSGGNELTNIPEFGNASVLHSIFREHIRPKAIPLTLFNRLFFSDIFIHGTGGSKYDTITDGIIQKFFKTPPPCYITASITKFPDIKVFSKSSRIEQLEKKIRDISFNPDRYISRSNDDIRRKRNLLDAIKLPGTDKKKIGMEIKDINRKLLPLVRPARQKMTEELSGLKAIEKRYEMFMRRDFPFFFFRPMDITSPLKPLHY